MRVRVLGSAAGGGFPQWNCACSLCQEVRSGNPRTRARTESQLAVTTGSERWHLLNASPSLREQLQTYPDFWPVPAHARNSPIRSVLLTSADIDHTAGLLQLRERQPLKVYAIPFVQSVLREGNHYFKMLEQTPGQTEWIALQHDARFELEPELFCTPYAMKGRPPFWTSGITSIDSPTIGLVFENRQSGKRLGYFPGVGTIDGALLTVLSSCDVLFFDGTFWEESELASLRPGSRTARQMQHVPISGTGGSLQELSHLPRKTRKIFTHINNTNPILREGSPEWITVREFGWEVAFDGMELDV